MATAMSYRRLWGANERIGIGILGCGGRGQYLLQLFAAEPGVEIRMVCDVYAPRRLQARQLAGASCEEVADYRKVLERRDIDAVVIATPDHWHVRMTLDAIAADKDVYVEKPVSHDIAEGEALRREAAQSQRVIQAGYQQRSWPHFLRAREAIASGILGQVSLALTSWYQNYLKAQPPRVELDVTQLDWQQWLGPAPAQPFDPLKYAQWRWFWDFGGGHLTDLFSHWCDTLHWLLDLEFPTRAQAAGAQCVARYVECPDTINASWEYAGLLMVYNGTMHCRLEGGNIVLRGERAMMRLNRDGSAIYPEGVLPAEKTSLPQPLLEERSSGDGTVAHIRNFLECIRSRKQPNSRVEDAVRAAHVAHLGNLAYRLGRPVEWGGTR